MHLNIQKEQFSIAYIRAVAAVAGVKVAHAEVDDDSVDVMLERSGGVAPKLDIQLKCTSGELPENVAAAHNVNFTLKLKNYEDLSRVTLAPRWLVVLWVPELPENWMNVMPAETILKCHARWLSLAGFPETDNETSVKVSLPHSNVFDPAALTAKMDEIDGGLQLI